MIKKTLSIYWAIMRPHRLLWAISLFTGVLFFTGINVILPFLISKFIGSLTNVDGKSFNDFSAFLWAWGGVRFSLVIIGRIEIITTNIALTRTLRDIDLKSFSVTLAHSSDFFANNFTGSIVTKFNRFARSFDALSQAVVFEFTSLVVQIVFPFIILLYIAPTIAFIFLVWALIFGASLVYVHKKKIPQSRRVSEFDSRVTGAVADTITNALSVKMFSSFTSEFKSFTKLSQQKADARFKNLLYGDFIRVYKFIFITALELLIFIFTIQAVTSGSIDVADVVLIQLYVLQLVTSLWNFGKIVEKLEEALADATEMTEIYDLEPTILDVSKPDKFENILGSIKLKNVGFKYKGNREQAVFNSLDLDIPVGQKIGFVGPSGGGKTTLTKLLLRFMDVTNGKVTIDGINIADVSQDDLRRCIAYVPQEPLLFHRSIYDNILYGDPDASKEEVLKASKLAHADEFIKKLPYGYETLVGERGVKLSGGQKQRVAIARAMLKKAPILILDEATSALDSKSEKLITSALDKLMESRTTIVIAHRLSTIKKLDRIVVLTDGEAIEDGTHNELLKLNGLYSELWHHQHDDFL